MNVRVLRGDQVGSSLDASDRGLLYGDGVFETLLVHRGQPVWWSEHWQRLARGARVLGLPLPDEASIRQHCQLLLGDSQRAVLKIILTRGVGGRGYAVADDLVPTVVLSLHPAPEPPPAPIAVRWCRTALAIQPALAGIKHLNRLEQVLARAEWNDPEIAEGLMCDTQGRAVCATAGNIFARIGGRWLTPPVQHCGIAGVLRAWLLDNIADAGEVELSPDQVETAEALFICNSVRGILPVGRLGLVQWPAHEGIARLRRQLAQAQPAFDFQEQ